MAVEEKNIQIKDLSGNLLFPKTKGAVVINNAGQNLGGVEAGAQVNVLESITVDGQAVTITNKVAAITLPTAAEYTVAKKATANTGYLATYELKKDGVAVGDAINIPKDFLVKSASMEICETADTPIEGLEPGDPYLDFVINTKGDTEAETDAHIYINVADLVDVYTAGNGIDITNNVVKVDLTGYTKGTATALAATDTLNQALGKLEAKADEKVVANAAITGAQKCKITYDSKGLVTAGADLEASDIPNLASSKIAAMTGYEKASAEAAISASDSLNAAIGKLEYKADNAVVKNAAITGATKCKITYDAKGLVTAGADLAESDIPSLHLTKVTDVTATAAEVNKLAGLATTATELGYVNGVTSAIQDQIDGKQATITGAATSITSSNLTASMFLASDASGKVAATAIPSNTLLLTYEEIV